MDNQPSASILVPAKSLFSDSHHVDGVLRPGTFISRQLANRERSFILSFHTSSVSLSFNTAGYVDDVEDGALWVRVALLEGESLAMARSRGKNLILLENIYVGAEVVAECAIENGQARLYIQWNRQLISIQYFQERLCQPGKKDIFANSQNRQQ